MLWAISVQSHTRGNQKLLHTSIQFLSINTDVTEIRIYPLFFYIYIFFSGILKSAQTLQLRAELEIKVNL